MSTSKAGRWSLALVIASNSSLATPEWRAEALVGRAKQYADSRQLFTAPHGQDVSYGLRLGGYFLQYVGVDVAYFDYGGTHNSLISSFYEKQNIQVQSRAIQIGVVGEVPIGHRLLIKARVGHNISQSKLTFVDNGEFENQFNKTAGGQDPFFSIGTALKIDENVWLSLEYNYSELKHKVLGIDYENVVENLSAGWIWRFK